MPKIERTVWLKWNHEHRQIHVYSSSDNEAIIDAIHKLEGKLGKMRGALTKHFKNNPDDIAVELK